MSTKTLPGPLDHHARDHHVRDHHARDHHARARVPRGGAEHDHHHALPQDVGSDLAEALRVELAPHGVDVLSVAPGPVRSGFAARADMRMGATVAPDTVARGALDALGTFGTVRPGALSKLLELALSTLPRFLRVRVIGIVMRGMTSHRALGKGGA